MPSRESWYLPLVYMNLSCLVYASTAITPQVRQVEYIDHDVLKRLKVNGLCKTYRLVSTLLLQPWAATGVMTGEYDIMSVQENVQRITLPQPGKPNMQSKKNWMCVSCSSPKRDFKKANSYSTDSGENSTDIQPWGRSKADKHTALSLCNTGADS